MEKVKLLSLQPDEHMKWIYDTEHRDCNTDRVRDLRERRAYALRSAPRWMREEAALNDQYRAAKKAAIGNRRGDE